MQSGPREFADPVWRVHKGALVNDLPNRTHDATSRTVPLPSGHPNRVDHDIRHELATILLLLELIADATNVEHQTLSRVGQLRQELSWLVELGRVYESNVAATLLALPGSDIRLDHLLLDTCRSIKLSSTVRVRCEGEPVSVRADALSLWRVLSNLVWNGLDAAGPDGTLILRCWGRDDVAYVEIEDNGPGLDQAGDGSPVEGQGLRIIDSLVPLLRGRVVSGPGKDGGRRVRLAMPRVAVAEDVTFDAAADL